MGMWNGGIKHKNKQLFSVKCLQLRCAAIRTATSFIKKSGPWNF